VLFVEAIEKSANVTLFAKHSTGYMDETFVASHDGPPGEWISASHSGSTFHETKSYLAEEYEVHPPFYGLSGVSTCGTGS
jgi:hypothetical protein